MWVIASVAIYVLNDQHLRYFHFPTRNMSEYTYLEAWHGLGKMTCVCLLPHQCYTYVVDWTSYWTPLTLATIADHAAHNLLWGKLERAPH